MISKKLKYSSETMAPDKMMAGDILIAGNSIFELIECLQIDDEDNYWFLVYDEEENIFDTLEISLTDDSVTVIRQIQENTIGSEKSI